MLLPAELLVAELAEAKASRRAGGAFGHHDPPWVRALFEPRGHVDRIARHHRLSRSRVRGRKDLTGVHAGSDLERHAEAALEIRVDLDEPFAHPQGSPEGSRRVVLMCGRHAERRHHGIADELLDRPALRLDLLPHRSEVRPEHLLESLRVQAFAEARRARHIREQDRHHAPVLTGGSGLGLFERGPARRAEPSPARHLGAAGRTRRDERRPTGRAEAGAVEILGPTCRAGIHGGESTTASGSRDRRYASDRRSAIA